MCVIANLISTSFYFHPKIWGRNPTNGMEMDGHGWFTKLRLSETIETLRVLQNPHDGNPTCSYLPLKATSPFPGLVTVKIEGSLINVYSIRIYGCFLK